MRGWSIACGGVSVLNAIATGGFGGAVQVSLCAVAEVAVGGGFLEGFSITPWGRLEIPRGLLKAVSEVLGAGGVKARVESLIPPASGLKSSSALSAALVAATADALGLDLDPLEAALRAVEASKRAGLTVTGALDDHLASLEPGIHVTFNLAGNGIVLGSYKLERCVPVVLGLRGERVVSSVSPRDYEPLKGLYSLAAAAAVSGDWLTAMRLNGLLGAAIDGVAGEVVEAYRAGALAAGVTGKGPTLFALADDPEPVAEAWRRRGLKVMVAMARTRGGCA